MDNLKILAGNACFLVKNTSLTISRKQFEEYLKKEGFEEFRKYGWKDRGCFYINVNSLRYAAGVPKPVKLTGTIVGESIKNPFTIDEFKTIWNILKKHIGELKSTDEITKGCSTFMVCDEILKQSDNEFLDYLNHENFKAIANDGYSGRGFAAVNVKNRIYSVGFIAGALVSSFVGDNSNCALTVDEFKTVWDIIKKHKEDYSVGTLLKQCEEFEDMNKVIECCDKIFEIDQDNVNALYYKTLVFFDMKEYEKAIDLANYAISIYPKDYRFFNIKAFIFTDLYRMSEAIECYNNSFYLGGFDADDNESTYKYRAICYLRKAREEYYINKDLNEALKSVNVYLNQFPEDKEAVNLKCELSNGKITPLNTRYHEKLMYFENKAFELFELNYLKEAFEAYREVLDASQDFKNNADKTGYKWFDFITGHGTCDVDNFRWYDEVLTKCLMEFRGDYREFFTKLYDVNEDNVSACVDKARLLSKIYRKDQAIEYSRVLVEECPQSHEVHEFYTRITSEEEKIKRLSECREFKDYRNIDEYIQDVIFCLIHSCGYSKEAAENFVKVKKDEIKRHYENKYSADDLAMDYYPICG